jgi:hypothetical protein
MRGVWHNEEDEEEEEVGAKSSINSLREGINDE